MPDRSSDVLQAMEIEQYFHADESQDPKLVNGHHINIYLKNSFLEDCKDFDQVIAHLDFADIANEMLQ